MTYRPHMKTFWNSELEFLRVLIADGTRMGQTSIDCPTVLEASDQVWRLLGEKTHEHQRTYILIYLAAAEVAWNSTP